MKAAGPLLRIGLGALIALAVVVAVAATLRVGRPVDPSRALSGEYRYDLSAMTRVDPALLRFTEDIAAREAVGLEAARAVDVGTDGTVAVAGDRALRVRNPGGEWQTYPLPFEPICVAVTPTGFFLGSGDRVVICDRAGVEQGRWSSLGERAYVTALAVHEDTVAVADAGQRCVWLADRDGEQRRALGRRDEARDIPGFSIPSPHFDLLWAPDGLLRVINPGNHRIEAYTRDGDLELAWGAFGNTIGGFTGCCNPIALALLPDGRFVTCEKGLIRVKLYDGQGGFAGVVAGHEQLTQRQAAICQTPEQCQAGAWDIAVDPQGRILVLDTQTNVLRRFIETPKGAS